MDKKTFEQKRHVRGDTMGWLLLVLVTIASEHNTRGACTILKQLGAKGQISRLKAIWQVTCYFLLAFFLSPLWE